MNLLSRDVAIHLFQHPETPLRLHIESDAIIVEMADSTSWSSVVEALTPLVNVAELAELCRLFEDPTYPREFVQKPGFVVIRRPPSATPLTPES